MSLLIKNGRIITASDDYYADVFIQDESVSLIGRELAVRADEEIDATGKLIIPGGIDPHTHLDMPTASTVTADDFESGSRAAAFGGTTTIIDFANPRRTEPLAAALDAWHARAEGRCAVDYGFHVTVTDMPEARLSELTALVSEGVTSFKFFTAYPGSLYVDDATLFRSFRRAADLGAVVCVHAENGPVIEELIQATRQAGNSAPVWHARSRPARLEAEATERALAIAEVANVPIYVVHLSCTEALDRVRCARWRGVRVTAETCPQYLLLDQDLYLRPDLEGAKWVMTPPLRERSNHDQLWRGLATGELQTVATDHCSFNFVGQKTGVGADFTSIPNGAPGIENRLALIYSAGVAEGRIGLNRFVEVTSTAAAKAFGLFPRKGTISVGSDADIVVFDPQRRERISASNPLTHHMRVDYSAYEGHQVQGWPETVVLRGRILVSQGAYYGGPGYGRYLKRSVCGGFLR